MLEAEQERLGLGLLSCSHKPIRQSTHEGEALQGCVEYILIAEP
jgi:hypothetical protein